MRVFFGSKIVLLNACPSKIGYLPPKIPRNYAEINFFPRVRGAGVDPRSRRVRKNVLPGHVKSRLRGIRSVREKTTRRVPAYQGFLFGNDKVLKGKE